jgi:MYXO-CTERM domain-containing protein
MKLRLIGALGAWLLATSPALALSLGTFGVTAGGLNAPNANYGCPAGSADCLAAQNELLAGPSSTATGTLTVTDVGAGTQAHISLDVASVSFNGIPGVPNANFTNLHYDATVSVFSTASVVSQLAPGTGTITGTLNGTPFTTPSAALNLTCAITGTTGQCGMAFGPGQFTAGGDNWLHTFALVIAQPVPEAGTAAVVLLGLAGLVLSRRR